MSGGRGPGWPRQPRAAALSSGAGQESTLTDPVNKAKPPWASRGGTLGSPFCPLRLVLPRGGCVGPEQLFSVEEPGGRGLEPSRAGAAPAPCGTGCSFAPRSEAMSGWLRQGDREVRRVLMCGLS